MIGAATNSYAGYVITIATSPDVTTKPKASGQSYFDVSFSGGGQFTFVSDTVTAVDAYNTPLIQGSTSPFSSLAVDAASTLIMKSGQKYNSGSKYRLLVDWTVSPTWKVSDQYGVYLNLNVNQPNAKRANAGNTDIVNIQAGSPVAAPEPGQMIGGAMLLGCGVLGFSFSGLKGGRSQK